MSVLTALIQWGVFFAIVGIIITIIISVFVGIVWTIIWLENAIKEEM